MRKILLKEGKVDLTQSVITKKKLQLTVADDVLITSQDTLQWQAGLTMKRRAHDLSQILEKDIKVHHVSALYKLFGIKKKKIDPMPKEINTLKMERRRQKERKAQYKMLQKTKDMTQLHLDETIFSLKTPHYTWSAPYNKVTSNHYYRGQKNVSAIVVINENGLVHHHIQEGYLTDETYYSFL